MKRFPVSAAGIPVLQGGEDVKEKSGITMANAMDPDQVRAEIPVQNKSLTEQLREKA